MISIAVSPGYKILSGFIPKWRLISEAPAGSGLDGIPGCEPMITSNPH